ncbi:transcriptional regulator, PucR family protein [Amycolatopsis methanolica 239]|uniref:Transcriptional regulator, PucR family protein n=1 Tax=Amycolatopsis methanolica 239 TaxID=1068978 RepID=A0A076MZ90_AMYME|nr:transcriptional regulator, PucR family protein [Amycolatopsis methanolica 239]
MERPHRPARRGRAAADHGPSAGRRAGQGQDRPGHPRPARRVRARRRTRYPAGGGAALPGRVRRRRGPSGRDLVEGDPLRRGHPRGPQRIVADRYAEVEFARTTHEVFTSCNIACASSTDIVPQASQLVGQPLVLEDLNRRVLTFCAAGRPTAPLLAQWAERSRRQEADPAAEEWASVEVGLGPERWARLLLPEPVRDRARVTMVLERAAQSLHLHRIIQQERDALVGQAPRRVAGRPACRAHHRRQRSPGPRRGTRAHARRAAPSPQPATPRSSPCRGKAR